MVTLPRYKCNRYTEYGIQWYFTPFLLAQEEVEVLNVSWQDKLIKMELYGNLPPVSSKVGFRRLKLASHCVRHLEEEASKLVLWQPMSGRMNMGRPAVTYIDNFNSNTNLKSVEELRTVMLDGGTWKRRAELP